MSIDRPRRQAGSRRLEGLSKALFVVGELPLNGGALALQANNAFAVPPEKIIDCLDADSDRAERPVLVALSTGPL